MTMACNLIYMGSYDTGFVVFDDGLLRQKRKKETFDLEEVARGIEPELYYGGSCHGMFVAVGRGAIGHDHVDEASESLGNGCREVVSVTGERRRDDVGAFPEEDREERHFGRSVEGEGDCLRAGRFEVGCEGREGVERKCGIAGRAGRDQRRGDGVHVVGLERNLAD